MTLTDTDNDGMTDYQEDANKNGKVDSSESNPLDMDSDDDGLKDGHTYEKLADSDSDNKYNCIDPDSDNDGIYDGTEAGVTVPIQGNDEIGGTDVDQGYFKIDKDPLSTTDSKDADTDDDGLFDGIEDRNKDGAIDTGETDPNDQDTDDDGLYDGSAENTYGDDGEDTDDDGQVDDGETDPLNQDSDGDNLFDGDEVNPEDINKDDIQNRYDPNNPTDWYNSDPTKVDTDGDNLNDDDELIGWEVRVFWEATLETMGTPYNVWSDPVDTDTDNDDLDDLSEFRYGSDPNKADTDDDNTNDDDEVAVGDNPCGIEGRSPEVASLSLSATPIVANRSGLFYLDGWNVKLSLNVKDSSGPYFITFREMNSAPKQKYLQDKSLEYYATDVTDDIEIEVPNDGTFTYASGFVAYIEDSVGNNVSVFIAAGGLPNYDEVELRNAYEISDETHYSESVKIDEWLPMNGTYDLNIEGMDWLTKKISYIYGEQVKQLFSSDDTDMFYYGKKFLIESIKLLGANEVDEVYDFLINTNIFNIQNDNENQQSTRGATGEEIQNYVIWIVSLLQQKSTGKEMDMAKALLFLIMHEVISNKELVTVPDNILDVFNTNSDNDNLKDYEEDYIGTKKHISDSDGDGLIDSIESGGDIQQIDLNLENIENDQEYDNSLFVSTGFDDLALNKNYIDMFMVGNFVVINFDATEEGIYELKISSKLIKKFDLDNEGSIDFTKTAVYIDDVHFQSFSDSYYEWSEKTIHIGYLTQGTHKIKLKFEDTTNRIVEPGWDYIEIYSIQWTDPEDDDSDDDGLTDGEEINNAVLLEYESYKDIPLITAYDTEIRYFGTENNMIETKIPQSAMNTLKGDLKKTFKSIHFISEDTTLGFFDENQRKIVDVLNIAKLNTQRIKTIDIEISSTYDYFCSLNKLNCHGGHEHQLTYIIYYTKLIIYSSLNPNDKDPDKDGLNDGWEFDGRNDGFESFYKDGKSQLWESISDGEKPNPFYKDLYVENDWMDGYDNKKLKTKSKNHLIDIFLEHNIRLHIDNENWGGIGGTLVNYEESINGNDLLEYRDKYSSDNRNGVFIYSLIAHIVTLDNIPTGGKSIGESIVMSSIKINFVNPWEDFIIYLFLHELGHIIIPKDSSHLKGTPTFPDWAFGKGNIHCPNVCALNPWYPNFGYSISNYDSLCWDSIDLTEVY